MELLRVLANHNPKEGKEHRPHERNLEPNFELKSSKERQKVKHQKDANKDIGKMAKCSNFHGKDNMAPKDVMSFLKYLKNCLEKTTKRWSKLR
jgi:hypothetical protein